MLAGQNEAGQVELSCASLNEAEGQSLEAKEARASVAAGASVGRWQRLRRLRLRLLRESGFARSRK